MDFCRSVYKNLKNNYIKNTVGKIYIIYMKIIIYLNTVHKFRFFYFNDRCALSDVQVLKKEHT
jgi:hypothetical protein